MDIAYLCGGEGVRLRPLTYIVPKPMLPIGSKPILEINILKAKEQGFKRIFLLVNYKAEVIESYFGNGEDFGVEIKYIHEEEPRGTAGPLVNLLTEVNEPLVVMNADILTDLDLPKLVEFHKSKTCQLTMGLKRIRMSIPYGLVQLDAEKTLKSIEEKPEREFLINSGIYVVSREAIEIIPPYGMYHMTDLIDALITSGKRVAGFEFDNQWRDIGRLDDYLEATSIAENRYNKSLIESFGIRFKNNDK